MSTGVPADQRSAHRTEAPGNGWYGWIAFASVMMVLLGSFHAVAGLIGVFKEDYYLVGKSDLVVTVDYTAWGWTHLILGLIVAFAGVALTRGATWARVVAVAMAFLSALVNLAFMPAYPLWSLVMIAVDFMVIYAVTAHGGRDALHIN
ncbi:DUF7144 family membrane protein [Nocardioides bizhenqiangii]|uniref:DUF7144 domain-containing protein n=1 Tax=Nocardioides bizhenqiangii TaxID=3095076 RepID=A0ABZ0ZWH5_9ACTN|nr:MULTISPECIES: hypothetical protein [unclassified Nocardioides]MDZ5623043.1 hypothetical protein [Nocardioides sp. HM23]WQQ28022.1 hypothetical protein SHK19_07260 [Nocardioides sp. HM61]